MILWEREREKEIESEKAKEGGREKDKKMERRRGNVIVDRQTLINYEVTLLLNTLKKNNFLLLHADHKQKILKRRIFHSCFRLN